jgi:hypothetical protein
LIVTAIKGIGNVFKKDKAKDNVLVFSRVHVGAQFVGSGP